MGGRESFREEGKEELAKSDWGFGISEKEKGSFASETGRSGAGSGVGAGSLVLSGSPGGLDWVWSRRNGDWDWGKPGV